MSHRYRRAALCSGVFVLVAVLALACAAGDPRATGRPATEAPGGSPVGGGSAVPGPTGPGLLGSLPDGRLVRVDRVTLGEDGRTVTMHFIGGRPFNVTDPCSVAYGGFAAVAGDVLEIAVVEAPRPAPGGGLVPTDEVIACDAMGHARVAEAVLPEPFTGTTVRDLGGGVIFLGRPAGSVELGALAPDWTLRWERSVEESPTGRWWRTYALPEAADGVTSGPGILEVYQAFDGPANVTGGEEIISVTVGSEPATLYRHAPSGELVLVWQLGDDGLALVANEADFTTESLIALAESAVIPD